MASLIRLTLNGPQVGDLHVNPGDGPVAYINPTHITAILEAGEGARVYTSDGHFFKVSEPADVVFMMAQ